MIAESHDRMASNIWFSLVVFSAVILWMAFCIIGSFVHARSQGLGADDDSDEPVDRDDDRAWFFGFYNNPEDDAVYASTGFIRRGFNLGNPVGLALMFIILLGFTALDVFAILGASS